MQRLRLFTARPFLFAAPQLVLRRLLMGLYVVSLFFHECEHFINSSRLTIWDSTVGETQLDQVSILPSANLSSKNLLDEFISATHFKDCGFCQVLAAFGIVFLLWLLLKKKKYSCESSIFSFLNVSSHFLLKYLKISFIIPRGPPQTLVPLFF